MNPYPNITADHVQIMRLLHERGFMTYMAIGKRLRSANPFLVTQLASHVFCGGQAFVTHTNDGFYRLNWTGEGALPVIEAALGEAA